MNAQLAIFLALLTAVLWGLAPVFYKQFYKHCSSYLSYIIDACFGSLLILLPFALLGQPDSAHLVSAILLTAPYSLSYLFFLMAFEFGEVSLVSVITQTYPIVTLLLAVTLTSESLSVFDLLLMLLIVLASMFIGLLGKHKSMKFGGSYDWLILSVLAALFLGMGNFFLDESVALYNVHTTTLAIFISQVMMSAVLMLILRKQMLTELSILTAQPALIKSALFASIAMSVGAISLYKAFDYGSATLVSFLSSLEPVFAIVFACFFLKERLSVAQFVLVGVAFAALYLLVF